MTSNNRCDSCGKDIGSGRSGSGHSCIGGGRYSVGQGGSGFPAKEVTYVTDDYKLTSGEAALHSQLKRIADVLEELVKVSSTQP